MEIAKGKVLGPSVVAFSPEKRAAKVTPPSQPRALLSLLLRQLLHGFQRLITLSFGATPPIVAAILPSGVTMKVVRSAAA